MLIYVGSFRIGLLPKQIINSNNVKNKISNFQMISRSLTIYVDIDNVTQIVTKLLYTVGDLGNIIFAPTDYKFQW